MSEQNHDELRQRVEQQAQRMRQAEHDRPTLLTQTIYLGTLALLFVLPVIGGAYLGHWIDAQLAGYSFRWTVSCIVLGVMLGGWNVARFIQEHP